MGWGGEKEAKTIASLKHLPDLSEVLGLKSWYRKKRECPNTHLSLCLAYRASGLHQIVP